MKCPKCGYVTSEKKRTCGKCGFPLPARKKAGPAGEIQPDNFETPNPVAEPGPTVPEWRREVTQKVRAYGERKKILTTPPGPLKQAPAQPESNQPPGPPATPKPRRAPAIEQAPPATPRPAQAAVPARTPQAPACASPRPVPVPPIEKKPGPILQIEVHADDFDDVAFEEPQQNAPAKPLLLGRRISALLIDSTILVGLNFFLLYVCAEIIGYSYGQLLLQAWLPFVCVFLVFHCVYYTYFYRTSRQTPGQVFLGIELKDPASGTIVARKILVRWGAMVFLNVLNLLTLMDNDKYLLLDKLSSTEIRKIR